MNSLRLFFSNLLKPPFVKTVTSKEVIDGGSPYSKESDKFLLQNSCIKFVWHYSDGTTRILHRKYIGGYGSHSKEIILDASGVIVKSTECGDEDELWLLHDNLDRGTLPGWEIKTVSNLKAT